MHRRRQNVVRTKVTHSTSMSRAYFFVLTTFWCLLCIYKSTDARKNGIYFLNWGWRITWLLSCTLFICVVAHSIICTCVSIHSACYWTTISIVINTISIMLTIIIIVIITIVWYLDSFWQAGETAGLMLQPKSLHRDLEVVNFIWILGFSAWYARTKHQK